MHARLIILSACVFLVYCFDFNTLKEDERTKLRIKALGMFQFLNSMRVDPHEYDTKSELSISDLLSTADGRNELKALGEYFSQLYDYKHRFENFLSKECYEDEDKCHHQKYFDDHQELFQTSFVTYLSLGAVHRWPRHYYNRTNNEFYFMQEKIKIVGNVTDQVRDLGPAVPKFEFVKDLLKQVDVYKPPRDVSSGDKWVEGTPERYQMEDFYELNHVVPLPLLVRFCEVFSATWSVLDKADRKILSAPFRVLKAVEGTLQVIEVGTEFLSKDFDGDYEKLKQRYPDVSDFEFYILNHVLWAYGNLFFGFKNRVKPENHEDAFEISSEVIIGRKEFKKAYNIYNRMLDFMDRVQHASLEQTAQNIKSDESLVSEMTEILVRFIHFGKGNSEILGPYKIDLRQWEYNEVLFEWTLKSPKEYKRLLKSLNVTKKREENVETDDRESVALMMDYRCNIRKENILEISPEDYEYKELEDFHIRSIMTNKSDALLVLNELTKAYSKRVFSLAGISNFLRDESKNYYNKKCEPGNLICAKAKLLCDYGVRKNFEVKCDDNSEYIDQDCPKLLIKKRRFVATPSFTDWCNGRRFENKYQLTTDSILIRAMSYNATKPNLVNKKSFFNIYRDFKESAFETRVNDTDWQNIILPFFKFQLLKFNTTANRILNEACKFYKKSLK